MAIDRIEILRELATRVRVSARLPFVLTLVLMVIITYRLASLTWRVLPDSELHDTLPPDEPVSPSPTIHPSIADANIAQWTLFGRVGIVAPQPVVEALVIPETRLNLTLLGLISSNDKVFGKAIISDSSGSEDYYAPGMMVPGGAIVEEIHADHVILKRNNRLEILRLPQEETLGVTMVASLPRPVQLPMDIASRRMPPSMVVGTEAVEQKKTGTLLRELRDTLNNNPQNLADVIRTDPVREGDHLIGYRVNPGRDRQVIARFGLTSGDIITSVNGLHLDSPAKGSALLQTLQTAKQVKLEVLRSGVAQTLSFDVDP